MWPLLVLVVCASATLLDASELTCFFPGKVTKPLFGGQCLQYQLMYRGTCRSYFRLESSGLLCLLEADVYNTARVNPHDVTCPSTEESDCVRYRRYCGGGGGGHQNHQAVAYQNRLSQAAYSPCGPSGCRGYSSGPGLPPLPSSSCSYPGCGKPGRVYDLPSTPLRENFPYPRATSVVYGPPPAASVNSLEAFRQCPAGTCRVGGHCVPAGQGHYGTFKCETPMDFFLKRYS